MVVRDVFRSNPNSHLIAGTPPVKVRCAVMWEPSECSGGFRVGGYPATRSNTSAIMRSMAPW